MTEAEAKAPPQEGKPAKEAKAPKEKKEPSVRRSNFANIYPEDAKISLLVEKNPKKEGSKSRERFEAYFKAETVGDYLAAGGTYQDIAYDVGRGFVKVG